MKATALTVICVLFLGAISGCGGPEFRYLEDPAPRRGSQQAQAKIDSFIKELEGKSLDELSEREYNLLLAQVENENEFLRARAKADEAMTERNREKTYRMVSWINMVGASLAILWYVIRLT